MVSTLLIKFSLEILLFVLVCLHIWVEHHIQYMVLYPDMKHEWNTIDYKLKYSIYSGPLLGRCPSHHFVCDVIGCYMLVIGCHMLAMHPPPLTIGCYMLGIHPPPPPPHWPLHSITITFLLYPTIVQYVLIIHSYVYLSIMLNTNFLDIITPAMSWVIS